MNDVNIKAIKKSQVTITGTIDGVYKAKQQLIVRIILHFFPRLYRYFKEKFRCFCFEQRLRYEKNVNDTQRKKSQRKIRQKVERSTFLSKPTNNQRTTIKKMREKIRK